MNQPQVRMLLKVVMGEKASQLTNNDHVTKCALVKAGILVHSGSGGLALTDDVRYSLLLDEPDHHHAPRR